MKFNISKIGVALVALALVVAPTLALAQSTPITVSIVRPANGADITVNTDVTFEGAGSGGTASTYNYYWKWGDGTETTQANATVTHRYTTTGTKNVELRITDVRGNTGVKTMTVDVVNGNNPCSPLIIESGANIPRAINVTQTSATIVWETCEPATSRVVYDTVSHPGQNPVPGSNNNYGYAFTTSRDDNKVTQHSVTLTNLQPNTRYYFRVLSAR